MEIDPDEFRRRYAELSDAGLLSIDRDDLTELAQLYYDAEVARRGLQPGPTTIRSDSLQACGAFQNNFVSTRASYRSVPLGRRECRGISPMASF